MIKGELKSQMDNLWEVLEKMVYEKPAVIMEQIEALNKERADLLKHVKVMLG